MGGANPPSPPPPRTLLGPDLASLKSFHREAIGAMGCKCAFITIINYTAKSRHLHKSKGSADFCLHRAATPSGSLRKARPLSPCIPPPLTQQEILYKPIKRARIGTDLWERGGSAFPANERKC